MGSTINNTPDLFLSGRVVLSDGTPLTESVAIQTSCNGQKHTEGYTDPEGDFSIQFAGHTSSVMSSGIADADSSIRNGTSTNGDNTRDFRSCQILASLAGFSSDVIDLGPKYFGSGSIDVGRITLRRFGGVQGTTISASAAAAPSGATKAYFKGREDQKKDKWESAQKHFEEAVKIYPSYAPAWFELGRTQVLQNNVPGARESFEKARVADPKFVSPYQALAELAAREEHWAEVVQLTDTALTLNATDFPQFWFLNAIGNFDLHRLQPAEKSVREAIKLDGQHKMPKMEYLLGLILAQRQQYPEATEHMQRYLSMVSTPAEMADAQKQLSKLVQLSASAKLPATAKPSASTQTIK
ncbi:MAG: tetratricopeptide repeat protein [Acidobacteriales bacterium]|nr:tetratricopeptide repeat protein [Terriglobales bacterium]